MLVRILLILPSTPERADACVPLVVSAKTVARAGHPESWIATREIRLRVDHLHHGSGLRSLHFTDEGPQQMQAELHPTRREDTPTSIWLPVALAASRA